MTRHDAADHLDEEAFTPFVEGLDYPVYVVTTAAEGETSGCLVGFATQSSIDPPRLLVCLSQANHTHGVALAATHLAVHLVPADRHDLGDHTGHLLAPVTVGEAKGETLAFADVQDLDPGHDA